ncbi:MAG: putative nucleotidyltransferase substrate binding domain-containing protein [Roseiarcus sp.]|jgi:CBS domain-containing protein
MAQSFDATNAPFDRLTPSEVDAVRAALDIGYFRRGETIIARDSKPASLFVVIKGCVEERDGGELVALRGPGDCFDSRALVQGGGSNAFLAREETLCNLLPRNLTLRLINRNARFAAFFYRDISRKLDAATREEDAARFSPLMNARVRDLSLHPAAFIEASDSIAFAAGKMREMKVNALFVRAGERVGIVTRTDLSRAAILERLPIETSVAGHAQYAVVSVAPDDFVSMALLKMTKHNKRRVAVIENGGYVGILEDIELLSFLAGNSQLVAARIDRAANVAGLASAAREIAGQTRMLRRQGVKIEVVCEIVSDLNRRLFAKLFAMTASPAIREDGCLVVMGSEGRGEQTFRTDQDNGLILSTPAPEHELQAFRNAFSGALEGFGFPPCPGGVMVVNPLWSKTIEDYRADIRRWLALPDEHAHMNVAILYDAEAVAGDAALLRRVKLELVEAVKGERAYLAHFARAVDAFPTPIGLFNNLVTSKDQGDAVDLKKGGIFPIVHGVRSLAIEHGLLETGTAARIARLAELGALTPDFARELTQALHYLMTLRLDGQLAEAASASLVRPGELSGMERDLLRDAFQIVKQLREIVRRHFNLAMF